MVCKEDVLTWFKDAASYKRIDVMCSLLNMCIPFELRYLGTCIEEQGKHDYQELRGAALIANSLDKLAKELCGGKSLLEKCTRHRLTVYVSLLQSRNYTCAQWMYSVLLRSEAFDMFIASGAFNKDITLHTELLLLYTMVLNHPAFTFDQKRYFGEIVTRLSEYEMPTTTTMAATGALVPPPTHNPQPPPPCPPGLGYAIKAPLPVHHIPLTVGKPPNPLGHGEPPMPPPGIPLPTVHGEFVSPQGIWSRTHYISTTCPPPEMTAFPPPISPLVSQQSSPTPSRSVSPSRMYTCRPHPPPPPPPSTATIVTHMDRLPPPQVKDPLVMPTPQYNTDLKTVPIDEVSHGDVGDKTQQHQWLDAVVMAGKLPNGLIPGVPVATAKCPTMFISGDMQNLSLDGDMPLRCSSSSASSNSSDCHSPPDTPTGPGRGPHGGGGGSGHLPLDGGGKMCRTANVSGPPGLSAPLPTAADLAVTTFTNNCTVPYSTHYPPTTSFHPSRTMYYSQTYRPHQFPPAAYQQNGEIPYMFPPHYLPMLYSSAAAAAAAAAAAPAPMPPAKLVNCYNCGMTGHTGAECKEPTIEEITQKKGYQLEYTTPPPEIQPQQQQGTIVDKQHQPHQQSQQQHQQSQQPNQQQQ